MIELQGEMLLDTHVLIWMVEGNKRLSEDVNELLRQGSRESRLVVSAITPWEIGVLVAKKRMTLHTEVQIWINQVLSMPGLRLQPLLPEIAVASTKLPEGIHPDPADRILIATARHLGATLLTVDMPILRYAREGHLRCLDVS